MHSATELVTRSIKVMMESGCEERCFVNTTLEDKLWNLEDENHVLRQKALSSPKGSHLGFVKPFLEKYSAALALPYADQKPVFESPTPTKLIAPLSQGLSDSRRTKLTTERQQENYEFLSSCIKEDLGLKIVNQWLLVSYTNASERTAIFYYIIEGINEVLKASQASLEWLMKKRKAFDRRGDMVVAAWAEQQQQQHEMNLRVHHLSRSKE